MAEAMTLETLDRGSLLERFDAEFAKILENVLDPNTAATAVRSVTITVKIKPTDARDVGETELSVTSKLAPPKPRKTILFIGRSGGRAVAAERDLAQTDLVDLIDAPTTAQSGVTDNAKIQRLNNA